MPAVPEPRPHQQKEFKILRPVLEFFARPFLRIPPNLVTLFALVLVLPMCVLFATGHFAAGAIVFAVSMIADGLDGTIARWQQREDERLREGLSDIERRHAERKHRERKETTSVLFQRGETAFGTDFDPAVDKVRYYAAIMPLAFIGLPWPWWMSLIFILFPAAIACTLTLIRFMAKVEKFSLPSNRYGKVKVWLETAAVGTFVGCAARADILWAVVTLCLLFGLLLVLAGLREKRGEWNATTMLLALIGGSCLYGSILVYHVGWVPTAAAAFLLATALGVVSLTTQAAAFDKMRSAR